MDSGIAFLGRGGSKVQDFCWVSIDCPFTDLSKGGDTTYSLRDKDWEKENSVGVLKKKNDDYQLEKKKK